MGNRNLKKGEAGALVDTMNQAYSGLRKPS
jgi:hypothetical protein